MFPSVDTYKFIESSNRITIETVNDIIEIFMLTLRDSRNNFDFFYSFFMKVIGRYLFVKRFSFRDNPGL